MKEKWFCNEHLTFFQWSIFRSSRTFMSRQKYNSEFWILMPKLICIFMYLSNHFSACSLLSTKKTVSPAWVSWMCVQIRNSQNLMCVIMHWTVNEFHFQWKSSCPSSRCNILISTQFMCDLYFGWLNLCELFRNQV